MRFVATILVNAAGVLATLPWVCLLRLSLQGHLVVRNQRRTAGSSKHTHTLSHTGGSGASATELSRSLFKAPKRKKAGEKESACGCDLKPDFCAEPALCSAAICKSSRFLYCVVPEKIWQLSCFSSFSSS